MPLEAPAIRHFIGHKCLTSLIPSLSILLHVTVWEWDKSRMVWEWDRPSVWFVTLSCQSPISVRCAVALRPSVLWWPVTISHFSPNERFWPVCGCEGYVCVCDGCVCVCVCVCVCMCVWWLCVMVACVCVCVCEEVRTYHCMDLLLWWLWCQWSQNQADVLQDVTRGHLYQQLSTHTHLKVSAVIGCSLTLCKALSKFQLYATHIVSHDLTYSTSNIGTA